MIYNYISHDNILFIDDYTNTDIKLHILKNIRFRTMNSNYYNFQTQVGINSENKIINITNRQLSYLIQKNDHFIGDQYAQELKKNYEHLRDTVIYNCIEETVFQFFDYDSVSSTGHSFDLMFYLLYFYKFFNLHCKLLVVENDNKYYNSLLDLIKIHYHIDYFYIKEGTSYLFERFLGIKTFQNVLFDYVKTFLNDTLIKTIIDRNICIKPFDNLIKIKFSNADYTNRCQTCFEKTLRLQSFMEQENFLDLNNVDSEELKIFYLNKAKYIIIDWGSSFYININYYLLNTKNKTIIVIFHPNMMTERYMLYYDSGEISQRMPTCYYPGVPTEKNIYNNFIFRGQIIDNISDINDILSKLSGRFDDF